MKGVKAEWATLPRRKCDDCGKGYKPKQPVREGERGFCTATCRKAYHKHGGAYRKLRVEMEKMVDRKMLAVTQQLHEIAENAARVAALRYIQAQPGFSRDPYPPVPAVSKPAPKANR